jgi:hypothetical protein
VTTTLSQIRFIIERNAGPVENESVVNWCNEAQSELIMLIEIPTSATIAVTTTDLAYTEPVNIKRINRLWLQSERDSGIDRDISKSYRRYGGKIIFERLFGQADTLNIEFYKHFTYFTDITQSIDLEDRYTTLYTSYGQAQYYDIPSVIERLGDQAARRQYDKHYARYLNIKDQIAAQYTLETQPSTIKEAW